MEEKKNDNFMREFRGWFLSLALIGIIGWAAYAVVNTVQTTTQNALAPIQQIQQSSDSMRTQVAGLLNPTPTIIPDPITIIHDIRTLARLETIQYSVEKVITAETAQQLFPGLFGDRLLFVAHGTVIAGVDLEKLNPEDLTVENGVVTIKLPPAEVFVSTLDNDKSYVYDRQTGLLTHGDVNLESNARAAAETEIEKAAIDDGILQQAQTNAENYLTRLITDLGYADVIFIEPTQTPTP